MKLTNIGGFRTVDQYVGNKIALFREERERNMKTLFRYMFSEGDNVLAETSDGYRIKKETYAEVRARILASVPSLRAALAEVPLGSAVGLYMQSSLRFIEMFWIILASGYRPLLMNTRLMDSVLDKALSDSRAGAVISDGKIFSLKTLDESEIAADGNTALDDCDFADEVIFMSSGTSERVKLCAFTGENFSSQVLESAHIIAHCPDIKRHYEGELKQLVLLPLCHVFGFIAMYLWFCFFSRTLVFPKDLSTDTVRKTVIKHKVTHIFAVPTVWEAVHRAAVLKIRSRGGKVYRRFTRLSGIVNRSGAVGKLLARKLLGEVRQGLFGDSICFLISGGSGISRDTLKFFNGIGYHLANGYGMTELGITSVETSSSPKLRNLGSIGQPYGGIEYAISEEGELLVRGDGTAARIFDGESEQILDPKEFFHTGDLAHKEGERYYIDGRCDDLIVSSDGENFNPTLAEGALETTGVGRFCAVRGEGGAPVLLVEPFEPLDRGRMEEVLAALRERIAELGLDRVLNKIFFMKEKLLSEGEFKLNRRRLSRELVSGELSLIDPARADSLDGDGSDEMERMMKECFAEALGRAPDGISAEADFFFDLGGSSLEYFALLGIIRDRFGREANGNGARLATVRDFLSALGL